MTRRPLARLLVPLLALLVLPAASADEDGPDWTVLAAEDCVAGPDVEEGPSPDWEDLCTVAWRTLEAGEDVPTTVQIQLTAVGDVTERLNQMVYETHWTAGSCAVVLHHRDASDTGPGDDVLVAECGGVHEPCTDLLDDVLGCDPSEPEQHLVVDVAAPAFAGRTVTWTLTFADDLAPLAAVHAAEADVLVEETIAGDGTRVRVPVGPSPTTTVHPAPEPTCVGSTCTAPFSDRVDADAAYTIGG